MYLDKFHLEGNGVDGNKVICQNCRKDHEIHSLITKPNWILSEEREGKKFLFWKVLIRNLILKQ